MTPTTYIDRVCTTLPHTGEKLSRVVRAVFLSLDENAVPSSWERGAVLERLAAPDRSGVFTISWMDDRGRIRTAPGYYAGYGESADRGTVLFRPGLTLDEMRCRAFLGRLGGALTGRHDGFLCGAAADVSRLSDPESMRFCRGFADALRRCDPPAVLDGMPERERGYLMRASPERETAIPPAQAAGYGLGYYADEALRRRYGTGLYGRNAAVLGANVTALAAAEILLREGALLSSVPEADILFLCDDGRPLGIAEAEELTARRPDGVFEGVNLACGPGAACRLEDAGIPFHPWVICGAGGSFRLTGQTEREAERTLRRGMRGLADKTAREGVFPCAVTAAAEALIRRGV